MKNSIKEITQWCKDLFSEFKKRMQIDGLWRTILYIVGGICFRIVWCNIFFVLTKDINKISLPFPLGLVLGSEGEGIRYGVQKHLDIKAQIPMEGAKLSFNVNMACAIFCYEISKQRTLT